MASTEQTDLIGSELLQWIPAGVGVYDVTGNTVRKEYLNDGYYQMIGAARKERRQFDGTAALGAVLNEDLPGLLAEVKTAIDEKRILEYTFHVLCGGGNYRRIAIRANHVPLNEKTERFYTAYYDISNQFNEEQIQTQKLREALFAAESANRAKTEFVSHISHDIRTPISIISSMTDFALEDMGDAEKLLHDLVKIRSANTFLLSLINDVLDLSKIDSGRIELNAEPYSYEEHYDNIRNMLESMCEQKGLRCAMERRNKTGAIFADKIRLNQILMNLISNAVKYTPAGGTVTYISDSEDLGDGTIRFGFELIDTGIGMSEEFQKIMFEPFAQEQDNPLRPKDGSGTGLGLPIVKKTVDLLGGKLRIESKLGKGTTCFCSFVFPRADEAEKKDKLKVDSPKIKRVPLHGKVLLAEDNEINAEIAGRLVESFGLTSDSAEDGLCALEMFTSSAPQEYVAVLMDIQMPKMNGYEVTEQIRALSREDAKTIPIIAMTADAFSDAAEHGRMAGMDDYLIKPLDPDVMYRSLYSHMKK